MIKNQMTERILNLTLEIIYILTGEEYVVKKHEDDVTDHSGPCVPERFHMTQSPIADPPPAPLTHDGSEDCKILEPTNRLLHLLAGEVPARCEDIEVRLTLEKEDQKDHNIIVVKKLDAPDSVDGSGHGTVSEVSLDPRNTDDSGQEDNEISHECEMEMFHPQCKEEEIPMAIGAGSDSMTDGGCELSGQQDIQKTLQEHSSADGSTSKNISEDHRSLRYSQACPGGNRIVPSFQMEPGEGIVHLQCKEEGIPTNSGGAEPVCWEAHSGGHSFSFQPPECIEKNTTVAISERRGSLWSRRKTTQRIAAPVANVDSLSCDELNVTGPQRALQEHLNLATHQSVHQEESGNSLAYKSRCIPLLKLRRGRKQYICPDCGKCFRDNSCLIKHHRTHTGEKPFECPHCSKCFTHKSTLVKHQRLHTGTISCPDCGKWFSDNTGLVIHRRIHTGEKPFACSECGRRFTQMPHLIAHQSTHKSDKRFACAECGKCFSVRSVLVAHQKVHTQGKQFVCMECGKSFAYKSGLVTHQRTHMT